MERVSILILSTTVTFMIIGCAASVRVGERVERHKEVHHEEVELASYMGSLQRFSQKLGYSIQGKNQPLSEFYLHELVETLDEIKDKVEVHEGLPIASTIVKIVDPVLPELDRNLEGADWKKARRSYESLIEACNRCHAATEHEFILMTPALGEPPYNQSFTAR